MPSFEIAFILGLRKSGLLVTSAGVYDKKPKAQNRVRRVWLSAVCYLSPLLVLVSFVQRIAAQAPLMQQMDVIEARDLRFRGMSANTPLSQTRAEQVIQDHLGFLWIGTQYGLNRFDGSRIRSFVHDPNDSNSLGGTYVRSLFLARDGSIWIGFNHGFDRFNPATENFTHFNLPDIGAKSPYAFVRQFSEVGDGSLWISTSNGLFRFDPRTKVAHSYPIPVMSDPQIAENIMSAEYDRAGNFWVGNQSGLSKIDPETGHLLQQAPITGSPNSVLFHEDRYGRFWITSGLARTLSTLDRKDNVVTSIIFPTYNAKLNPDAITAMLEDKQGDMWFGTMSNGLLHYEHKTNRYFRYRNVPGESHSLPSERVTCLTQDDRGDIWVGLHDGSPIVFTPHPPIFEGFEHDPGHMNSLHSPLVTGLFEDHPGHLLIGTTGALQDLDRGTGVYRDKAQWVAGTDVLVFEKLSGGDLLLGTSSQGLLRVDSRTGLTKRYPQIDDDPGTLSSRHVQGLLLDTKGRQWVATWGGLDLLQLDTGKAERYLAYPRGKENFYAIAESPDGQIWLGSNLGLTRFDPETRTFHHFDTTGDQKHATSSDRINSILFDHRGSAWIGTQSGLDRLDLSTLEFEHFTEKSGLRGNVVSCVMRDRNDSLWMSTNKGISRLRPALRTFTNYDAVDGLPGTDFTGWNACFTNNSGEMFFGGFAGAVAFRPEAVLDDGYVPPVVLTDIRVQGQSLVAGRDAALPLSITYTRAIRLRHDQNAISLSFAVIDFLDAQNSRYRFRLDGVDTRWIETTSDQQVATYVRLPPGRYQFHVQSATSRGPWSDPGASLDITIAPPWWETWLARILAIVVFAVALFLLNRRRKRAREERVKLRIEAQVTERTRVAREIHDTLLQSFQGVILAFEGAALGLPEGNSVRAELERTLDRAEATIGEGRDAIQRLRDSSSAKIPLPEAIRAFGEGEAALSEADFDFSLAGIYHQLPWDQEVELLLIAKEALHNAFRHSRARRINCAMTASRQETCIVLRDDGLGIPAAILSSGGKANHWGLRGMRERAEQIGATFEITSAPGEGSIISLSIRHRRNSR